MFKTVTQFPSTFFSDYVSEQFCKKLNLPVVPARAWWTHYEVCSGMLPIGFDLLTYAKANRLDVIYFKVSNDYRIHPEKITKISQRALRKYIRRR